MAVDPVPRMLTFKRNLGQLGRNRAIAGEFAREDPAEIESGNRGSALGSAFEIQINPTFSWGAGSAGCE